MDVIYKGGLKFELDGWRPGVTSEMDEWLNDNGIQYDTKDEQYGPGDCHYLCYIWFETIEDAMAFKLGWS